MINQYICQAITIVVLLCSPLSAIAENWVEFYFHTATNTKTGQTLAAIESFYDNDSFRMFDDGTFKVWIKSSTLRNGELAKLFGKSGESKELLLINCNNKTFENLSAEEIDLDKLSPESRRILEKIEESAGNPNRGKIKGSLVFEKLAEKFCTK
jgi:hypothetical protein